MGKPRMWIISLAAVCGLLAAGGALLLREATPNQNDAKQEAAPSKDVPQVGIVLEDYITDSAAACQKYGERVTVRMPVSSIERIDGQYIAKCSLGLFGGTHIRLYFDEHEGQKIAGRANSWIIVRGTVSAANYQGMTMFRCELLD